MKTLKRENWWIWLLLFIFTSGASNIILGALLDVFDENAWYAKWQNWLLGFILFVFPAAIMAAVFVIELSVKTAAKLGVAGSEVYLSPFVWILCLIIPLLGWVMFIVMMLYIQIWTLVKLYQGAAEEYI